jgi:hypothetical protein
MWPADRKVLETGPDESKPADTHSDRPETPSANHPLEPVFNWPRRETAVASALPADPQESEVEPRTVAILKSGVVDGMGYTLYVDGSIEAELPQGTLRFASISELRSHLEKTL